MIRGPGAYSNVLARLQQSSVVLEELMKVILKSSHTRLAVSLNAKPEALSLNVAGVLGTKKTGTIEGHVWVVRGLP